MVFSGITAVALVKDNSKPDNVSSTVEKPKDTTDTKDDTPQLRGLGKQETKTPTTDQTDPNTQTETNNPTDTSQNSSSTSKQNSASSFDFSLNKTSFTLSDTNLSDNLTASTGDNTAVAWQVQLHCENDQTVQVSITQNNNAQLIAELQMNRDAQKGTKCQGTVTAKDASRNINVQKQFSVTVQ
jgi:hypothetical protein